MHVFTIKEILAFQWTTTAFAFLVTLGRFYVRLAARRSNWSDVFHGLAIAFLIAFTSTWLVFGFQEYNMDLYKLGVIKEKPPERTNRQYQFNAANTIIFWCVIYSVKASFLAFYWSIFEVSGKFRIAWRIAASYTAVSFVVTLLWTFWVCGSPLNYLDPNVCPSAAPKHRPAMLIAWCILDFVGDLLLIGIPMIMVRRLGLQTAQKIGLVVIFCIVFVNILLNLLRTVFSLVPSLSQFPSEYLLWIWLQATTAVVVCGLPCFGFLLSRKREVTAPVFETLTPLQMRFAVEHSNSRRTYEERL
ncbi:hypothetical protein EJ04DRAFT_501336 [Polyplosphaeria fusca]|uniref:Rhodopsin domain-containing protein n=1 Tax=Polyplosphaeria fusca TaxID=682080 RepID=A0A9P4QS79_9PLEO|nr:hypothetical protein EJ04DRAFT_501336 [Polyplosphaeria fusca]